MITTRINAPIYDVSSGITQVEFRNRISDAASRRHLSWGFDFDSRSLSLSEPINENWDPEVKESHYRARDGVLAGLIYEFGNERADQKAKNFADIGPKPVSVLTYHNRLFDQVRRAFVAEDYYPALVGACALGERILNHLILDLRDSYTRTPEYKYVYGKQSFNDWEIPISVLEAWNVLLPTAATEFRILKALRHRSIHFNIGTYSTLRDDALAAIIHLGKIIEEQFASFALRPWFISGTKGNVFIRKEFETHPFIATYYIPLCPFVGPMFGMSYKDGFWSAFDYADYGGQVLSDDDFAAAFNKRNPSEIATAIEPKIT